MGVASHLHLFEGELSWVTPVSRPTLEQLRKKDPGHLANTRVSVLPLFFFWLPKYFFFFGGKTGKKHPPPLESMRPERENDDLKRKRRQRRGDGKEKQPPVKRTENWNILEIISEMVYYTTPWNSHVCPFCRNLVVGRLLNPFGDGPVSRANC